MLYQRVCDLEIKGPVGAGGVFTELAEQDDAESDEGLDIDGMPGELPASMLLPPGVLV